MMTLSMPKSLTNKGFMWSTHSLVLTLISERIIIRPINRQINPKVHAQLRENATSQGQRQVCYLLELLVLAVATQPLSCDVP